jgi:hypothetical protein
MKLTTGTIKHWLHGFTFQGRALSIQLRVSYTATPYDPGITHLRPEDCYPPEGGDVEDCTFDLLAVQDEDGEHWSEETIGQDGPQLLAAVDAWFKAGDTEQLAEAIGMDCMENRYDDEPDFYPD